MRSKIKFSGRKKRAPRESGIEIVVTIRIPKKDIKEQVKIVKVKKGEFIILDLKKSPKCWRSHGQSWILKKRAKRTL